jgi:putative membrane protein
MSNLYFIAKSLHLIGAFSWMAGLFYLVRIMVYHAEAATKTGPEKAVLSAQYNVMEWKAYRIILQPAVIITWSFGCVMLFVQPVWLQDFWFIGKMCFLLLLTGYTHYCKSHIKLLENNTSPFNHLHYRALNEVPTILMVGIIFLAVFKNAINGWYLGIGITLFTSLIFYAVKKANRA